MRSKNFGPSRNRPGVRHFGPNQRSGGRKGSNKQFINPSRFVKAANPSQEADYTASNSFADFQMHPLLKSNVARKGYEKPSEIQDKSIPIGLSGQDVVGIANTGTGKTAAFALPILNKLMHERGSRALIIAPTRELALQIEEECIQFSKSSGLFGALLIGGLTMSRQIRALKANPAIVIGTPGRLKDHVRQGTLNLSSFNAVVLDEVDRMLDMGFINDVRFLLNELSPQRQSFFFSATLRPEIKSLIQSFTQNPVTIDASIGETSDNVHQDVVKYPSKLARPDILHDVLISPGVEKTLIFSETKYGAERLSKELEKRGFKVAALHGGKSQGQRTRALDSFRDNRINILVATDVAARGIDVKDISHVINYDTPNTYDDYVHRIGRAGRAGRMGHALTFVEG